MFAPTLPTNGELQPQRLRLAATAAAAGAYSPPSPTLKCPRLSLPLLPSLTPRVPPQVFVSYGPKSNGELLLAYGVVPATRNPSDSVSLLLALSPDDPLLPVKEAALRANGLSCPLSFPVRMDGWPSQLLAFARLVAAGPSVSEEQIRELAAATSFAGSPSSPSAPAVREKPSLPFTPSFTLDHELEAREVILAACRLALAGYSTTLQDYHGPPSVALTGGTGGRTPAPSYSPTFRPVMVCVMV
ncbi:unnamed protein product [Closterium sp. NIES-54]